MIAEWFGQNPVVTIALVCGGLLGAAVRARWSGTQVTASPKTTSDLVLGGILPALFAFIPPGSLLGWEKVPGVILLITAFGMSLSATWALTAWQWNRRMAGQPPEVMNAAPPPAPAGGGVEPAPPPNGG